MPVPFGISVGDSPAVGNLALEIIKALNDSQGAVADYKSLCDLLFSLSRAICAASDAIAIAFVYPSSKLGPSPYTSPLNGVRYELGCCRKLMEEFLEDSKEYTKLAINRQQGLLQRWMGWSKKITWCLYKTEDVRKLQERIQGHLNAFQLYIVAIAM